MTDTELIATKLLGWERIDEDILAPRHIFHRYWSKAHGDTAEVSPVPGASVNAPGTDENWPDLTNWNDIRRIENALAENGAWDRYEKALERIAIFDNGYDGIEDVAPVKSLLLRSTTEQRVAACVRVLREANGSSK